MKLTRTYLVTLSRTEKTLTEPSENVPASSLPLIVHGVSNADCAEGGGVGPCPVAQPAGELFSFLSWLQAGDTAI